MPDNIDLYSESDESEAKEGGPNQQILLMCEDENEENEIVTKILHNNFN